MQVGTRISIPVLQTTRLRTLCILGVYLLLTGCVTNKEMVIVESGVKIECRGLFTTNDDDCDQAYSFANGMHDHYEQQLKPMHERQDILSEQMREYNQSGRH
ncbi:hypothetical protein [Alteromonas gilva]|uniref:Lipoprotein n=1 Tax=Alteromonas gilva TaxID=2987522 RepID=A0ABT5KXG7_9ALTE|nr:hypothetical protein [Alteromonas gilva]MDC8829333.1 hypothetical protein [Alteromonas gilva]